MGRAAVVCLLLLGAACDRPETEASDPPTPKSESPAPAPAPAPAPETKTSEDAEANTPDPAAPQCHAGIDALGVLDGKTEAEVVALYGEPVGQRTFKMADCCHEFEIELYNTYPPGKGHEAVEIHEKTWHNGENRLTVWAHRPDSEWVILDTLCYSAGTEF